MKHTKEDLKENLVLVQKTVLDNSCFAPPLS